MSPSRFIWSFVLKQPWAFSVAALLSFMWTIDTLFWPFYLRKLVDVLTEHDLERSLAWPALKLLLIIGAFGWIFIEGCWRIRDYLLARALPRMEADIRLSMFDHVQRHSPKYFNEHFAGSLANKIGDMVTNASVLLRNLLLYFAPALLSCILTIVIFVDINALLALIVAAWIAIHFALSWLFTRRCAELSSVHGEVRSVLVGKIVDSLTNNFAVNLFYRFRSEKERIAEEQKKEQAANRYAQVYLVRTYTWLSCAFVVEFITLTSCIALAWMHGSITTGEVVQLFYTIWNVSMTIWIVSSQAPECFQSLGIARQALCLMSDPEDLCDLPQAPALRVQKGEIVFENVCFRYGERDLFRNKSLLIAAGEKVGLVGYSGAGKSTFVNVILRFFSLDKGRILIDGQDIAGVTLESLRSQIALIPQEAVLFHRTLEENIRYGRLEASRDEVIEAAKMAHCDEFIRNCPGGYEALVGERGTKLSGGEKQRIAIARALLVKAPILILDEATSALDSVTERVIQQSLDTLMAGRTTIVVAHRLSTLSKMDRILVFDEGRIVEQGSHQALLEQNGHYARLWRMQAGGFLPDQPV